MIKASTEHKAVHDKVIVAEGSAKAMQRLVKQNGGRKAGWFVGLAPGKKVGDKWA